MQIWQAIVLGAVQGLAEFLPISSSGHLILLQHWFGITQNTIFYSVILHIGTLIPVLIVFWNQILGLFIRPYKKLGCLVLATLPAGILGLLVSFTLDLDLIFAQSTYLLAIAFLFTALELLFSEARCRKKKMIAGINPKTSFIMGLGQAIAVIPGLSRSGTTISAGCVLGVDKEQNANFSFLMSIPIILSAVILEGLKCFKEGSLVSIAFEPLVFGVLTAAICGYIAIKFMLKIIKKANYKFFSFYLMLLSVSTLITYFLGL